MISKRTVPEGKPRCVMLRERELAVRWSMSQRTLQRWRSEGFGPAYILIGGAIRYSMKDILDYENRMRQGVERS
jgi:hypothetical protein